MRQERTIESYIHDETLKDLIISNYLRTFGVLKDPEEVIRMTVSEPDANGVRTLRWMFIEEREVELIVHK